MSGGQDETDLERTIEVFEQAIEQSQPGSANLPAFLNGLGTELSDRYQRTHDLADLERAIGAIEQAVEQSQPGSPNLPNFLTNLGAVLLDRYQRTGELVDFERSVEAFEQAVEQSQPGSANLPAFLNNLGMGLLDRYERTGDLADLERAIGAIEQAVEQSQSGSDFLTNLGAVLRSRYERTGDLADLERAIEAFEQAVEQSQPDSATLPLFLDGLGTGLLDRYQRTRDLADLERAIGAIEQAVEQSQSSYAFPNDLGAVLRSRYERTGDLADLERAIEAFEQAAEQSQPGSPTLPLFLNNLGLGLLDRYQLTGDLVDLERSTEAYQQAIGQSQIGQSQPDSPTLLRYLLNNLGAVLWWRYQLTGDLVDLERSVEAYQQAIEQCQPGSAELPAFLNNLGVDLWQRFTKTGDVSDLAEATDIWEEAWSLSQTSFAGSPVAYKIGEQSRSTPLSAHLVKAHLKQAQVNRSKTSTARRRALEVAEGSKSRLLTELIGRADLPAPSSISPMLVDRERQLLAELINLDAAELAAYRPLVTTHEEVSHSVRLHQRDERLRELENLWTQMSRASHEAADYVALRRGMPPTWEVLARLARDLGAETALMSFFNTDDRALLFILRAGWEEPAIVENNFSEFTWTYTMKRLFREIHTSGGSTRRGETWHEPLKVLFEKAKVYLKGVTRIVFAPYSEGHRIPWSVVAERAGWRSPDERNLSFVTLPALGLLPRFRNRPSYGYGPALVAGNPLGDLKYAEEEAREVAAVLGTKPLLGPRATKAKIRTNLSDTTVVHLATHAYFDRDSPLDSGVRLADRDVLTAREVIDERLRADLLVLSACETGMARALGGDELAGLGQAFLQGGARSVIVSLWKVNDSATAALMKAFYEARRAEDVDNAQALNRAMTYIQEQEKWHHPYYWGAFVFIGDW